MKKNFNLLLMGALMCGLSLGVTSCKDDDDNNDGDLSSTVITIDSDLMNHGVETDIQSAVIDVPIKADGVWTATLTKGTDWCKILDWQVTYDGNQTLKLAIDENLTKAGRTCKLTIGNGDTYTPITIYQNNTFKGEDPSNGSGQAFSDKGLGTGIDYKYLFDVKGKQNAKSDEQYSPSMVHLPNNVFNITQIEKLMEEGKLNRSAYVEAPLPFDDLKAALLDSSVVQSKTLEVSLEIGISFGVIEFTGKGSYNSEKREGIAHVDYTVVRNAPMYNAYFSPAELKTYAAENRQLDEKFEDQAYLDIDNRIDFYKRQNEKRHRKNLNEDGLTEEQAAEIEAMYDAIPLRYDFAGIFSSDFSARYNQLYNAIVIKKQRGQAIDKDAADKAMDLIDAAYGPFYIAGADFGGMMAIHARVDTLRQDGLTTFGGSISVGALAGAISVSGGFEFSEEGYNVMHNIKPNIQLVGGNDKETTSKLMSIVTGPKPNDFTEWGQAMMNWITSMKSPDGKVSLSGQSQAVPISFIVQPVWQLFNEGEILDYARNYFLTKYSERGINAWMDIISGGVRANADALLNADSPFWQKYTDWTWSQKK